MKITMTDYDGTQYTGEVPADIERKINAEVDRLERARKTKWVLLAIAGVAVAASLFIDGSIVPFAVAALCFGGILGTFTFGRNQNARIAALTDEAKDRLGFPKSNRPPVSTEVRIRP